MSISYVATMLTMYEFTIHAHHFTTRTQDTSISCITRSARNSQILCFASIAYIEQKHTYTHVLWSTQQWRGIARSVETPNTNTLQPLTSLRILEPTMKGHALRNSYGFPVIALFYVPVAHCGRTYECIWVQLSIGYNTKHCSCSCDIAAYSMVSTCIRLNGIR